MDRSLNALSREEKLALLRRLAEEPREYPASFVQRRLWFLDRLEPGAAHNNVFRAFRLAGELDADALDGAVAALVRRHDALRTRFAEAEGEPVQVVAPPGGVEAPLARRSLASEPEDRREAALAELARSEAATPFDLGRAPLARFTLVELASRQAAFLVTLHHAVADGWSLGILFRELSALYAARRAGTEAVLPALPLRFGEFAQRQRRELSGAGLERELAFWRGYLEAAPRVLDLPADRPRPTLESFRGAIEPFRLDPETTAALKALGREERATPFVVLLAVWSVVLARWSGQDDLLVGTAVAGRPEPELEGLVGCFANTLVLRADLRGAADARALVRRLREGCFAAFSHQEMPFEHLVEALEPERDLSRNPLYQVMFALQNQPAGAFALAGVEARPFTVERGLSKVDLTLDLVERDGGLAGYLELNTDLFDRTTAARMLRHLERAARAIAADPDRPLASLDLASPAERHLLLAEWNDRAAPPPSGAAVHRLAAATAEAAPERIAVEADGRSWSYGHLMAAAGRLAARLRALGVGPESRVALCLRRSPEALAAFLGVLEAGGAYLPLDPEYPDERLRFLLEDSGARVALADADLLARLRGLAPAGVAVLGPAGEGGGQAETAPGPTAAPGGEPVDGEQAAYVIYTSGTTGRPKGVVVPHRALANHARAVGEAYGLVPGELALQFASLSFDIAGEEIFPALARGATLVLRTEELSLAPADLARFLGERRLAAANVPTPLWHEWVAEVAQGRALPPDCLRLVVVGTEGALPERLAAWDRALAAVPADGSAAGRPRWINAYGPTEATITATLFAPGPGAGEGRHRVPIGRPLANVRAYVAGADLSPAPPGVPGELLLGGEGVARGYLGRPAATAAAFVPDPFAGPERPGARLYRTGDRARFRPDGQIEFLGRTDDQVKVRGFRIEPGEVAGALAEHPRVQEAAVLAREVAPGDRRLVAYVVEEPGAGVDEGALRRHLADRLPAYMVPAAFVRLPELPLTPAGKVDRRALPEPERYGAAGGSRRPRGPAEELVAAIWCEVLGVEEVGAGDDFFRLGGHSLLAARVASRLRDRLGVEVPLRRLFDATTVEALARVVAGARADAPAAPAIERRAPDEPLPTSFAQQRLWFLDRLEPGSPLYNMPALVALEPAADRPLDASVVGRALGEIVRRHESLRTTFDRGSEGPLQVVHPAGASGPHRLAVVDLTALPAAAARAEAARLAAREARAPFDLARGPLVRFRLLRLPGDGAPEHRLLVTAHHAVSDGWSTDLFLRELALLYGAFLEGRPSPLPEPRVQYGDFALWQRRWLDGEVLAASLGYWREALAGAPSLLELPADRSRPPAASGRGGRASIVLSEELSAAVAELARRRGATPYMVLLTAFAAVLSRWSGQADVPVGTPVAGRSRSELEDLIGFFANTVVVRAHLGGEPTFGAALERVREATLGAFAHQDLPFEKLVEELQPERNLSHHPLFQVFFAYHGGALAGPPREAGEGVLWVRLLPNDNRTARFDLALNLWPWAGRLRGFLEYATDLFDGATAARMATHLEVLLEAAAAAPETPVAELPLLGPAERSALLHEWNDTRARFPAEATLPELLAEQAARTPDATAVVFRDAWLSYGELARRAGVLARHLRRRLDGTGGRAAGGRDRIVGVCAERSLEMVVALLGALEAGAAYLPLDPAYPRERLAFMLADAAVPVLLTQTALAEGELGETLRASGAEVVALDAAWAAIEAQDAAAGAGPAPPRPAPEDLAYVIYTSGSTGKPKGVMVPHRGIVNRLVWMQRRYGLEESDRVLQKTPFSFDVSVWELFWPLLTGARLVMAEPGRHGDPAYLAGELGRHGVTTLHFVPSMLQLFVERADRAGACPAARRVIASGEALPPSLAGRFAERFPGVVLDNLYGPTEASVDVTFHRCLAETGATVPIGRPIENLRVYVLDRTGRPAPVGVPGELHLAGVGLARGYLGRPGLTAERFVPDPFAGPADGEAGGRLYRTGDLCRSLPDGEIEFLGRLDFQVKVRGLRIELGEIEAALAGHPETREAVVTARPDGAGDTRLVAYLVAADPAPTAADLRRHLGRTLPEYMVPGAFVFLEALPLSPNGKVDRRRLPEPEAGASREGRDYLAPRTATEAAIAALWAEVLRVPRVGVEENFFELGGHSLKATQVAIRIEEAFGVELPVRALFESPTVAGLAERVTELELDTVDAEALAAALNDLDDDSEAELAALLGAGPAA